MNLCAAIVEFLQHGISDGATNAAAHHADLLLTLGLGRLTQRANEVLQVIALLLVAQLLGGGTDSLDDDGHRALLAVIVVNGDGDTLAVLIHTQDDELTGLRLLRHHGSLDLVEDHSGFQSFFCHNAIHTYSLISNFCCAVPHKGGVMSLHCLLYHNLVRASMLLLCEMCMFSRSQMRCWIVTSLPLTATSSSSRIFFSSRIMALRSVEI